MRKINPRYWAYAFIAIIIIVIVVSLSSKEKPHDQVKPLVNQIDSLKKELLSKDEIINKLRNMPNLTDKQQDSIIAEYESRF